MYGWNEKISVVDLIDRRIKEIPLNFELAKSYLGGRGLGVKLLSDNLEAKTDPLSEDNILIFSVGPITGVAPMSGRHAVISKSPLTGTIFDCSAGGFFGVALKRTGYDALVFLNRSDEPVYLDISEEGIGIKDATEIWGKNTKDTTNILSEDGGRVACIGRAGERQVPIANIMSDYVHACGRGGLGAVMGSKNLKAVVIKGSSKSKPEIKERELFTRSREEAMRLLKVNAVTSKGLVSYGTPVLVNLINYMNIMPTENFRKSRFEFSEEVSGEYINKNYELTRRSCYNCFIACKRKTKDGLEVPEYETLWAFGPDCENSDLDLIFEANRLCNDYGLDTISCGSTIACYKELTDCDIEDFTGIIEDIGDSRGNRGFLGRGSLEHSREKEDPSASMHVKGLELPGYDPRGALGMALSYATSNRGGCHLRAYMVAPEILGVPNLVDRLSFDGKAGLVQIFQNILAAVDSLVMCKFSSFALSGEEYAGMLSAITGVNFTSEDLMKVGERIWNVEKIFNLKEGFSRDDDTLPDRFFGKGGIDKREFDRSLEEYYRFRGWDEDGVPGRDKMNELRLGECKISLR
ncbi:MAG: aldehyde ferredoxin oxidoreductase family protein [Halobacteriota archaeon]|nr:aldehyde ferredoxin oxidoreductase family protein [Halobacteriota archaeon]